MFDGLKDITSGILRGSLGEYRPVSSVANHVIIEAGQSVFGNGKGIHYYDGYGQSETTPWFEVPDGKSWIVIRTDYKRQNTRIVVLRAGWRGWRLRLDRWINRITHRFEDISICEVISKDGWIATVQDTRQFAEYRAAI